MEKVKSFQCEFDGNNGLTVVVPDDRRQDVQVSIGLLGQVNRHRGVYLDRGMVANLIKFLTENGAGL